MVKQSEFRTKMFRHLGTNSYIDVDVRKLYIVKMLPDKFRSKTGNNPWNQKI